MLNNRDNIVTSGTIIVSELTVITLLHGGKVPMPIIITAIIIINVKDFMIFVINPSGFLCIVALG